MKNNYSKTIQVGAQLTEKFELPFQNNKGHPSATAVFEKKVKFVEVE